MARVQSEQNLFGFFACLFDLYAALSDKGSWQLIVRNQNNLKTGEEQENKNYLKGN